MPETMLVENEKFRPSSGGISNIQMFGIMLTKQPDDRERNFNFSS
jgi:hypothetical protein